MNADFTGKVALVTGASSGIGLAVARELARRGARVALVARTRARLEEVARELGEGVAAAFPCDVAVREAVMALPRRVVERFGRLDILVNNAGVNHRGPARACTAAGLAETIDTNLVAPMLLTHAALPYLRDGAAVVNVASLAGKVPVPDEAAYSASKAGLRAFARALAIELRPSGIRVSNVCPGPVDTGFFRDASEVPNLVFSQPMSTAEQVAAAVIRAIETGTPEIDLPAASGKLATLGYLSPALFTVLRPALERHGAKNKQRYLERRKGRSVE